MSLPPEGDPQRPLRLAIRLARVMGILFLALGLLSILPYLFMTGGFPRLSFATLIYVFPGTVYFVCSIFLARRQRWAAVTALVVVSGHLVLVAVGVVMFLNDAPWRFAPLVWIPFGVVLIFALALAAMGYHLMRSFKAIRTPPVDAQRGFEPLPAAQLVQPVIAPEDAEARHQNAQSRYRST